VAQNENEISAGPVNQLLMRVRRRAEKATPSYLTQTFVPIEPVPILLESIDNQVIYGRRGTGKTHLLKYLAELKKRQGDVALYVDLRTIGSSGGLYADASQPLAMRATHLLVDLVEEIHTQIRELAENTDTFDDILDALIPSLDEIAVASSQVRVIGATESAVTIDAEVETTSGAGAAVGLSGTIPSVSARAGARRKQSSRLTESRKQAGPEVLTVKFGPLGRAMTSLLNAMPGRHLWVLLDEWSSIPRELQPFLADLLRRSFFPVARLSVKIGALERQSDFRRNRGNGDYLGMDLGADTAASLDLDDFLVFRSDRSHAVNFFSQLLYQHLVVLMKSEYGRDLIIPTAEDFRELCFVRPAFDELVKASEGVPRDALNIAGLAAAVAGDKAISAHSINVAARDYFLRDKEGKISPKAEQLLSRLVQDCVVKETRVLVLRRPHESDNPLIQSLYDNRLIHRMQQGVFVDDDYSAKYDVYLVDYGCFANILARGEGRAVNDGTDVRRLLDTSRAFRELRTSWVIQLPTGTARR
jgi:hypothetical protein